MKHPPKIPTHTTTHYLTVISEILNDDWKRAANARPDLELGVGSTQMIANQGEAMQQRATGLANPPDVDVYN